MWLCKKSWVQIPQHQVITYSHRRQKAKRENKEEKRTKTTDHIIKQNRKNLSKRRATQTINK